MVVTLYKIGKLHFRLLGTNGFHVEAENERFIAAGSPRRQNPQLQRALATTPGRQQELTNLHTWQ